MPNAGGRHRRLKPTLRLAIRFDAPEHIAATSVTSYVATQKPHVLQELYTHLLSPNWNVRNTCLQYLLGEVSLAHMKCLPHTAYQVAGAGMCHEQK